MFVAAQARAKAAKEVDAPGACEEVSITAKRVWQDPTVRYVQMLATRVVKLPKARSMTLTITPANQQDAAM